MKNKTLKNITSQRLFLPIFCLALVLLVNIVTTPNFFAIEVRNGVLYGYLIDIINRASELVILAVGMTLVVSSSAGTDISVGAIMAVSAAVCCNLLTGGERAATAYANPLILGFLAALIVGAAIGCFNGFFVAKFKLHPFIVTLGTQLILYTVLLLYVQQGNNKGMAISNLDPSYTGFVKGSLFSIGGTPIPNYVLFAIVLTAVMWFVWNKTTFGKNMFALGSNEEAARVSGVNVFGVTVGVFALAGAMYGFTGFIEGARIGSNTANTGLNYELDAIAACVIGGVSFVGGIGKIRGIVIGVVMLRLIFVGLTMVGVPQDLQYLIKGAIILFACALDMRKYLVKK